MYSSCLWHSLVLPCNHRFRPRMQMQEWMHEHAISSGASCTDARTVQVQSRSMWQPFNGLAVTVRTACWSRYCRRGSPCVTAAGAVRSDPCRAEMATLIQSGNGSFDQNGWLGFRVR
jgi:hypothetical protein